MNLSITQIAGLRFDRNFRSRIESALGIVGVAIMNEDTDTEYHASRASFAWDIWNNPVVVADRMFFAIITDFNLDSVDNPSNANDTQLKNAITNQYNTFALKDYPV